MYSPSSSLIPRGIHSYSLYFHQIYQTEYLLVSEADQFAGNISWLDPLGGRTVRKWSRVGGQRLCRLRDKCDANCCYKCCVTSSL